MVLTLWTIRPITCLYAHSFLIVCDLSVRSEIPWKAQQHEFQIGMTKNDKSSKLFIYFLPPPPRCCCVHFVLAIIGKEFFFGGGGSGSQRPMFCFFCWYTCVFLPEQMCDHSKKKEFKIWKLSPTRVKKKWKKKKRRINKMNDSNIILQMTILTEPQTYPKKMVIFAR